MKKLGVILLLLHCVTVPGASNAADLHVPSEFDTIQAAVDEAGDGDRILLEPFNYSGQVVIAGKVLTIETVPCETGDRALIRRANINNRAVVVSDFADVRLRGVVIEGGLEADSADYVELTDCELRRAWEFPALGALNTREIAIHESVLIGDYRGNDGLRVVTSAKVHIQSSLLKGGDGDGGGCPQTCNVNQLLPGNPGGNGASFEDCQAVFIFDVGFVPGTGGPGEIGSVFWPGCSVFCAVAADGPPGEQFVASYSRIHLCSEGALPIPGPRVEYPAFNCSALYGVVGWDQYGDENGDWNADGVLDAADILANSQSSKP